ENPPGRVRSGHSATRRVGRHLWLRTGLRLVAPRAPRQAAEFLRESLGSRCSIAARPKLEPLLVVQKELPVADGNTKWKVTLIGLNATAAHLVIEQVTTEVFCRNYTLGGSATGTAC